MRLTHRILACLCLGAVLSPGGIRPACASGTLYCSGGAFGWDNLDLDVDGTTYSGALAGIIGVTYTANSGASIDNALCDDLFDDVYIGGTVTGYQESRTLTAPDQTNATEIGYFVNKYLNPNNQTIFIGANGTNESAGLQLAVWKLTTDSTFNLSSGNFQVSDDSSEATAAITDADAFYQEASSYALLNGADTNAIHLTGGTNVAQGTTAQYLVIEGDNIGPNGSTLPEPEFLQLGILLAMGGAGFLRRHRRSRLPDRRPTG